jgi:hypothetical protein
MPALGRNKSKQACDENGLMICPVCGKPFYYNPSSIYKIIDNGKTIYYSGYNCYRQDGGGWDKQKNVRHG